jgi:peptidoglycan hydrolase-like protein with peptidoglycan-binding domain
MNELKRIHKFNQMDSSYAARLEAWLTSKQGVIGIGSALRLVQPDKPGFAPPGKSFHELQQFSDGGWAFVAVDLVAFNPTGMHRSPRWDEVPRQGSGHPDILTYGVHCNVNGEPWHMQPMEIDGWVTWVNGGRLRPNPNFQIQLPTTPTEPIPEPVPPTPVPEPIPPTPTVPVPPGSFTVPTLTSLRRNAPNNAAHTQVAQAMLNRWVGFGGYKGGTIAEDGNFGDLTHLAVVLFQQAMGIPDDGVIGPQTWDKLYSDC